MQRLVSEPYTGRFVYVSIDECTAHVYDWYIALRKQAGGVPIEQHCRPFTNPKQPEPCGEDFKPWID